jgi:hemoglobin-like flavoprotein
MTPQQIYLVRSTWEQVVPIADTAAQLFYGRLFELKPELRGLFQHADMPEQRRQLIQMLAVGVVSLDKLDTIRPALENLGRRHVDYGVRDHHYDLVGAALLWTLEPTRRWRPSCAPRPPTPSGPPEGLDNFNRNL